MSPQEFLRLYDELAARYQTCAPEVIDAIKALSEHSHSINAEITASGSELKQLYALSWPNKESLLQEAQSQWDSAVANSHLSMHGIVTQLRTIQGVFDVMKWQMAVTSALKQDPSKQSPALLTACLSMSATVIGALLANPAVIIGGFAASIASLLDALKAKQSEMKRYAAMKREEVEDEILKGFFAGAQDSLTCLCQLAEHARREAAKTKEVLEATGLTEWRQTWKPRIDATK